MNAMNWLVVYPEIVLLAMTCVIAVADLFVTDSARRTTFWLTQATLAAVAAIVPLDPSGWRTKLRVRWAAFSGRLGRSISARKGSPRRD